MNVHEGEFVEGPTPPETALARVEPQPLAPGNLWGVDSPGAVMERATQTADMLARMIRAQKLSVTIQGRDHVRVEGWTCLGGLLGVFPVTVWTRELPEGKGWEARVEVRTISGAVVGGAEAMCTRREGRWKSADDYAIRGMAQTRAVSRALRQPLGFVMALAGYDPTPAEEMDGLEPVPKVQRQQASPSDEERAKKGRAAIMTVAHKLFIRQGAFQELDFYAWLEVEELAPRDEAKGRPSLTLCTVPQLLTIYERLKGLKLEQRAEEMAP